MGVEHSGKEFSAAACIMQKLFERIEHSGSQKGIKCKQTDTAAAVAT